MEHELITLQEIQEANLKQLATYLLGIPEDYKHFNMESFFHDADYTAGMYAYVSQGYELNICGTAACAVGHGPTAGILPREGDTWESYTHRCFTNGNPLLFQFLFGGEWTYYDNTPQGASRRITYFLKNGVPTEYPYDEDADISEACDYEWWDEIDYTQA